MKRIGFSASEKMSFENVDRRMDGRTTDDGYLYIVRWMTQVKINFVAPPRYQGCYISSCREFYAEFNAKCCQSGNLCRKFVNMIL